MGKGGDTRIHAGKIWLDGALVPQEEAKVSVLAHALHYGTSVFEGIRAYATDEGPAIFRLEEHVERFFHSAKILRLEIPYSPEQIAGRLRLEGSEHTASVETIYRFIYRPAVRRKKLYRFLPRAKAHARALVAQAALATKGGLVIIDGQKTDGIAPMLKAVRARIEPDGTYSKAHGKLFWFTSKPAFDDWADAGPIQLDEGFETVAGVFSAEKIDRGSQALIAALPEKLPKRLADLGAGWGYLSRHLLMREKIRELHLIEADHAALECARKNVTDPRAHFHWADATRFTPTQPFDGIISNPPFHTSRKADPDIGRGFITAAAGMLTPSGQLWLVANRHLPYERTLAETFRNVDEVAGDNAFKILRATRPLRNARPLR